ncbi:MAG: DapH/DapD/GlmU-related protein [Phycisphaerales bacterium]|jgi:putative colanic acid biosynthesis acetyltransferase WcaF|nr:DapH/DapD/GlmU-related protein [Phycisphaerales bacterium]
MATKTSKSKRDKTSAQSKAMEKAPPNRRTVWTPIELLIRVIWVTLARVIWVTIPSLRSTLLRLFGAKIGSGCTFSSTTRVTIPWNLTTGEGCRIGESVILYCLGPVTLGDNVRIDTRAHLCAGTHDMQDTTFPLLRPPISIGSGTFVGVDAFIAPDVKVGSNCTIWPRTSVFRDIEDNTEVSGNPARPVE